jgi:hypothetical protein
MASTKSNWKSGRHGCSEKVEIKANDDGPSERAAQLCLRNHKGMGVWKGVAMDSLKYR